MLEEVISELITLTAFIETIIIYRQKLLLIKELTHSAIIIYRQKLLLIKELIQSIKNFHDG